MNRLKRLNAELKRLAQSAKARSILFKKNGLEDSRSEPTSNNAIKIF